LLSSARTGTSAMVKRTRPENHTFSFRIDSHRFRFRIRDFYSIRARQGGTGTEPGRNRIRYSIGIGPNFYHRKGGNIAAGRIQPAIALCFLAGNATGEPATRRHQGRRAKFGCPPKTVPRRFLPGEREIAHDRIGKGGVSLAMSRRAALPERNPFLVSSGQSLILPKGSGLGREG
jgi:hypothetical protein